MSSMFSGEDTDLVNLLALAVFWLVLVLLVLWVNLQPFCKSSCLCSSHTVAVVPALVEVVYTCTELD